MKTLTLNIKQKWFDEIKAGKKTEEEREIRPTTMNRYIYFEDDETGEQMSAKEVFNTDLNGRTMVMIPIKYDALKLITGAYNAPHRPYMTVEVKGAEIVTIVDENQEPYVYEYNGNEIEAAAIVYTLGKVLDEG